MIGMKLDMLTSITVPKSCREVHNNEAMARAVRASKHMMPNNKKRESIGFPMNKLFAILKITKRHSFK